MLQAKWPYSQISLSLSITERNSTKNRGSIQKPPPPCYYIYIYQTARRREIERLYYIICYSIYSKTPHPDPHPADPHKWIPPIHSPRSKGQDGSVIQSMQCWAHLALVWNCLHLARPNSSADPVHHARPRTSKAPNTNPEYSGRDNDQGGY